MSELAEKIRADSRAAFLRHDHLELLRLCSDAADALAARLPDREAWQPIETKEITRVEFVILSRKAAIEECAKVAEGTAPIAQGNFFQARRDQCSKIATAIRALTHEQEVRK